MNAVCIPGREEHGYCIDIFTGNLEVEYHYTTSDEHFSCFAPSLEEAREKRDEWLMEGQEQ